MDLDELDEDMSSYQDSTLKGEASCIHFKVCITVNSDEEVYICMHRNVIIF